MEVSLTLDERVWKALAQAAKDSELEPQALIGKILEGQADAYMREKLIRQLRAEPKDAIMARFERIFMGEPINIREVKQNE